MAPRQYRGQTLSQLQATSSISRAAGQQQSFAPPPPPPPSLPLNDAPMQAPQPTGHHPYPPDHSTYINNPSQRFSSGYASSQILPGAGGGSAQPQESRPLYNAPPNNYVGRQQELGLNPRSLPQEAHENFPPATSPSWAPATPGSAYKHQSPYHPVTDNGNISNVASNSSGLSKQRKKPVVRSKSDPKDFRWRLYSAFTSTDVIKWMLMIDEPDKQLWGFIYALQDQDEVLEHVSATGQPIQVASFIHQLKHYGFERNKSKPEGKVSWYHPSGQFRPGNDNNFKLLNKGSAAEQVAQQDQLSAPSPATVAPTPSGDHSQMDYLTIILQLQQRMDILSAKSDRLEKSLQEEKDTRQYEAEIFEAKLVGVAQKIAVLEARNDDLTRANMDLEKVVAKQSRHKGIGPGKGVEKFTPRGLGAHLGSTVPLEHGTDHHPWVGQSRPATSSSTSSYNPQTASVIPTPLQLYETPSAPVPASLAHQAPFVSPPGSSHAEGTGFVALTGAPNWSFDNYLKEAEPGRLTAQDTSPPFSNWGRGLPTHSGAGQPVAEVENNRPAPQHVVYQPSTGGLPSEHEANRPSGSSSWSRWMCSSSGSSSAHPPSSSTPTMSHTQRLRGPVARAEQPRPMSGVDFTGLSSVLGQFSSSG